MTRDEFIQHIETLSDLFEFCYEHDITEMTEDVYSEEELQSYIASEVREYARQNGWVYLRDTLDDIAAGYDYYRKTGWMEFETIEDDEFDELKERTLCLCDESFIWDEEDDDEIVEEIVQESESDEEPIPEESITPSDLFAFARQTYDESQHTSEKNEEPVCESVEEREDGDVKPISFLF